jgi:hypothetical protein
MHEKIKFVGQILDLKDVRIFFFIYFLKSVLNSGF